MIQVNKNKKQTLLLGLLVFLTFNNGTAQEARLLEYLKNGEEKYESKDYSEAMASFNKALELDPYDSLGFHPWLFFNKGTCKAALEDYRGAIINFDKAIDLMPFYAAAFFNRAFSKYKLKDYTGALVDYEKVLKLSPKDAKSYYFVGLIKYEFGDTNGACLDWSMAGEYGFYDVYDIIKKYCK
jgi:tetratricopeptide (TPR) repeat protein